MSDQDSILSGIRVIDCGTYIAGPAAAVVLSDFGADVIKIERPPYGDPYRYLSLVPGMPVSPHYYCWTLTGRNKKSVALDLNDNAARDALLALVRTADVFITNYQPELIAKFRLSYDDLTAVNDRLIFASLTGYGYEGEERDKPGYDLTAYWARSGLMNTMHGADGQPCQSVAGFGDHPTSMALFGGIMLGLYRRQITGKGMHVTTSLLANGAWSNACGIQAALLGAQFVPRWTRNTTVNPIVNHYVTRDQQRFITCCLDQKKDWPNLCRAIDHEALLDDPRFASPELRRANNAALIAIIDAAVAQRDMSEWKEIFQRNHVIWGPVPATEQVAHDRQMEANGVFPEITPGIRTVANPLTIPGIEKIKPRMAPGIGEHTIQVLKSAGFSDAAIADLVDRGAAVQEPGKD